MASELTIVEALRLQGACRMRCTVHGDNQMEFNVTVPPARNAIRERSSTLQGIFLSCEQPHGLFVSCCKNSIRKWRPAWTPRLFLNPGCELMPEDIEYVNESSFLVLNTCAWLKRVQEATKPVLCCDCAETPHCLSRVLRDRLPSTINVSVDKDKLGLKLQADGRLRVEGWLAQQLRFSPLQPGDRSLRCLFPVHVLHFQAESLATVPQMIVDRCRFCTVTKEICLGRLFGGDWHVDLTAPVGKYDGGILSSVCASQCGNKLVNFGFADGCLTIQSTDDTSLLSFQGGSDCKGELGTPPMFSQSACARLSIPIRTGKNLLPLARVGHNLRVENGGIIVSWGETRSHDKSPFFTAAARDVPWLSLSGVKGVVYNLREKTPKKPVVSGFWPSLEIATFNFQGHQRVIEKEKLKDTTIIFLQ